jgi:endo-1,4-beta-D-glucanase Y
MNISFHLQKGDKTYSVTAFAKVVSTFIGEDIYHYKENTDPLTEQLLLLKDIDFYLSPDQKLVSQMKQHDKRSSTSIAYN